MTIIILTIIAIISVCIGLITFFRMDEARTYEELIAYRCESVIFILTGIFVLLLALLFKLNPFW
jgi:hypothetical protein